MAVIIREFRNYLCLYMYIYIQVYHQNYIYKRYDPMLRYEIGLRRVK